MAGEPIAVWFQADPDRLASEMAALEAQWPHWNRRIEGDRLLVEGRYPISYQGKTIETYRVRLTVPPDYPTRVPTAFEVEGLIPRDPDRHMSDDGSMCLFVPEERWKYYPLETTTIAGLLAGPVYHFLLNQAYYERSGEWLWPGRGHFLDGRIEYYFEEFDTRDVDLLCAILTVMSEPQIPRQWLCPCGSRKKIRRCHRRIIELHGARIPPALAADALRQLRGEIARVRERTTGPQPEKAPGG